MARIAREKGCSERLIFRLKAQLQEQRRKSADWLIAELEQAFGLVPPPPTLAALRRANKTLGLRFSEAELQAAYRVWNTEPGAWERFWAEAQQD